MSPAAKDSVQISAHEELIDSLKALNIQPLSRDAAEALDASDPLKHLRNEFNIPLVPRSAHENCDADEKCIYMCGNSLGLQPKNTAYLMKQELDTWAQMGVLAHFQHPYDRPWVSIEKQVVGGCAKLCGTNKYYCGIKASITNNENNYRCMFG